MLVAGLFLGDVSFAVKIFFNSISDDLTLVSSMQIGITYKVFPSKSPVVELDKSTPVVLNVS